LSKVAYSVIVFAVSLMIETTVIVHSASADEVAIENFSGLDGIKASCIVSTKRKYAIKMCTALAENGKNLADVNGVKFFFAGSRFSGNTKLADTLETLRKLEINNPLNVEFFIRGTEGKTAGASIRIVASVDYQQAIEKDGALNPQVPRSGKLVLWEEAAVANGPANRMGKALSAHMTRKLKTLINLFAQRKSK